MSETVGNGAGAHQGACPNFHAAVELIGRKWNGVILQQLLESPLRFLELRERIPRVTDAMLSQRLKELEAAAVVERVVTTTSRPVEVRYKLTAIGDRLAPVLDAVAAWGNEWAARGPSAS
ncbi:helix-turn-helix domain-containing protein [Umezawaea sp. Da 62-37]|uniref:winged helix-turn-helix transcriptional regulator n=1 Tax=Umezawaea sp. Da 62-37 TaxID=3075927 RepID=UPI0028F73009|nr:helix-turn-helix domain-containing protein [Umezawaea sp. Da 62-37]WNV85658.1 helix-turn-helix domain-containing protein [Umezawaea sp. Da 62-37]